MIPSIFRRLINSQVVLSPLQIRSPYELVKQVKELGRLPVVNFAAGGGGILDKFDH